MSPGTKDVERRRRRAEEQRQESQRMEILGRLVAGITHDFNNLVTIIMGYTEMVLARDLPEDLRGDVESIRDAAARAAGLNQQLMAFSRRQSLEPSVLDLRPVVAGVARMLRRLIGEDVQIVTDFAGEVGPVTADAAQVEEVVMNLALNAREAMPGGGTLTLHIAEVEAGSPPQPWVVLTVNDTGEGMDRETLSHAFEPFFTTKAGRGTGLGLATVQRIVGQYGGQIRVESEVGLGTTFRISLPKAVESLDVAEGAPEAPPTTSGTSAPRAARPSVRDLLRPRDGLENLTGQRGPGC